MDYYIALKNAWLDAGWIPQVSLDDAETVRLWQA